MRSGGDVQITSRVRPWVPAFAGMTDKKVAPPFETVIPACAGMTTIAG